MPEFITANKPELATDPASEAEKALAAPKPSSETAPVFGGPEFLAVEQQYHSWREQTTAFVQEQGIKAAMSTQVSAAATSLHLSPSRAQEQPSKFSELTFALKLRLLGIEHARDSLQLLRGLGVELADIPFEQIWKLAWTRKAELKLELREIFKLLQERKEILQILIKEIAPQTWFYRRPSYYHDNAEAILPGIKFVLANNEIWEKLKNPENLHQATAHLQTCGNPIFTRLATYVDVALNPLAAQINTQLQQAVTRKQNHKVQDYLILTERVRLLMQEGDLTGLAELIALGVINIEQVLLNTDLWTYNRANGLYQYQDHGSAQTLSFYTGDLNHKLQEQRAFWLNSAEHKTFLIQISQFMERPLTLEELAYLQKCYAKKEEFLVFLTFCKKVNPRYTEQLVGYYSGGLLEIMDTRVALLDEEYLTFLQNITANGKRNILNPRGAFNPKSDFWKLAQEPGIREQLADPRTQEILDGFYALSGERLFNAEEIRLACSLSQKANILNVLEGLEKAKNQKHLLATDLFTNYTDTLPLIDFLCANEDYLAVLNDPAYKRITDLLRNNCYANNGCSRRSNAYFVHSRMATEKMLEIQHLILCRQILADPQAQTKLENKDTQARLYKLSEGPMLLYQNLDELLSFTETQNSETLTSLARIGQPLRLISLEEIKRFTAEQEELRLGEARVQDLQAIKTEGGVDELNILVAIGKMRDWPLWVEPIREFTGAPLETYNGNRLTLKELYYFIQNYSQCIETKKLLQDKNFFSTTDKDTHAREIIAAAPYLILLQELFQAFPEIKFLGAYWDKNNITWNAILDRRLEILQTLPAEQRTKLIKLGLAKNLNFESALEQAVNITKLLAIFSLDDIIKFIDWGTFLNNLGENYLEQLQRPELAEALVLSESHSEIYKGNYFLATLIDIMDIIKIGKKACLTEALSLGLTAITKQSSENSLSVVKNFLSLDYQGKHWHAFTLLYQKFPHLSLEAIIHDFRKFELLASSQNIPLAIARVREIKPTYPFQNILAEAEHWDYAGQHPDLIEFILEKNAYFKDGQAITFIREIRLYQNTPEIWSFIRELTEAGNLQISWDGELTALHKLLPERENILTAIQEIRKIDGYFNYQPENAEECPPYNLFLKKRETSSVLQIYRKHPQWRQGEPIALIKIWEFYQAHRVEDCFKNMHWEDYQALYHDTPAENKLIKLKTKYPQAFTQTGEDKITPLFMFFAREKFLTLDAMSVGDVADFILTFGLQYTVKLYEYYQNILKHQRGEIAEFPAAQQEKTLDALLTVFKETREKLITGQLPPPQEMSPLAYDVLAAETMFYTSRWKRSDKNIGTMHARFSEAQHAGELTGLPAGYPTKEISVAKVEKNYDLSACQEEYQKLRSDVMRAFEYVKNQDFTNWKNTLCSAWNNALSDLENMPIRNEQMAKNLAAKKESYAQILATINAAQNEDQILEALYQAEMTLKINKEEPLTTPFIRQLLYAKAMREHSGFDELPLALVHDANVSLEAVQFIRDISQNIIKQHILKVGEGRRYFSKDSLLGRKKLDAQETAEAQRRCNRFSKAIVANQISLTLGKIEASLTGERENIAVIPDRTFVGELSGYYSEACYTRIDEMLKTWPNVIPAKLVLNPDNVQERKIIGAVLFIETTSAEGERVLIVRAINPRDEFLNTMQAASFCEEIFKVAKEYAKNRGCKKLLVTGVPGSISNREKIINHINNTYIKPTTTPATAPTPVPLKESLNFNFNYELQNGCYLVCNIT